MVVAHNLASMNANRYLGVSTASIKKSGEKLSSGYKINRAADDAAGLTISEKMRSQIRGLTQASANAQDGISFVQTADGTLDEVSSMLKRGKELAVKASTETLTEADRQAIQEEVESINSEIDRVQQSSTFNDFRIFIKDGYSPSQADIAANSRLAASTDVIPVTVTFNLIDSEGNRVTEVSDTPGVDGKNDFSAAMSQLADYVKGAVNNAVAGLKSIYPNLWKNARTDGIQIGLDLSNIDGKDNTLALAKMQISTGGGNTTSGYMMRVDTTDFVPEEIFGGSMDEMAKMEKLAKLGSTVAHEMTHLFMYDTMPSAMLRGNVNSLPEWFVEGVAQTTSGDGGWVSRYPNETALRAQMSNLNGNPYGAGYLAAMYLGQLAGNGDATGGTIHLDTIRRGLDTILNELATGKTLDEAIKDHTSFDGLTSFEAAFRSGSGNALQFTRNLMNNYVQGGAGSLMSANLASVELDVFNSSDISGMSGDTAANYNLNTEYQMVSNAYSGNVIIIPAPDAYSDDKGKDIVLQVGAANRTEQRISVKRFNISCDSLFEGHKMDMSTVEKARESLARIDKADANVSAIRSYYGAIQNRLEHTIANLDNIVENTTAAESIIRDTDMAKEMVDYTKTNILIQAGNAMLAQAMQTPQNVLQLLS